MQYITRNYYFFLAACIVFFSACQLNPNKPITDAADATAPVITFVSPESIADPSEGVNRFNTRQDLAIDVSFEDNTNLASYEVDITYQNSSYYAKTQSDPMSRNWTGELTGETGSFSTSFPIDGDAYTGPYELKVKVKDKAGNAAEKSTWIWVINYYDSIPPTISFTSPNLNPMDTINIGGNVNLDCSILDNAGLERALIRVRNKYSKELITGSEEWVNLSGTAGSIVRSIYVPPVPPGDYNILVTDSAQNLGVGIVPIYIRTNN